jgi:two-component system cell cycle sensor histidine kinase/response regulator CckA
MRWTVLAVAVVCCCWAGWRTRGPARLSWIALGLGAVAETLYPQYPVLLALFAASILKAPGARRPARLLDAALLGLLAVSPHFYGSPRLPFVLLGILTAAILRGSARRTSSMQWRRVYGLLSLAALCQAAARIAEVAEYGAFVLLAWAAMVRAGRETGSEGSSDAAAVSAWRELSVPLLVLAGLAGMHVSWGVLQVPWGIYVALLLIRQFLVQMENRSLALDLQQESMRLRLLLDNIHDAVITETLDGRIVFANDRFLELFGLGREQLPRARLEDCMHPDDRPLGRPDRRLAGLGPARFEFRGPPRDGGLTYFESSSAPVRTHGLVLGFQSVIRDITDRRQAEERQRELVQRLEFFVNNMPLGCLVWDLEYRIVEWNNSASRIFGWSSWEASGRHGLALLAPPEEWPGIMAAWQEVQENQSSNRRIFRNLTKERGVIECEWFNTSLIDQAGRVTAVASMVQDITEQRNLEAQLRQAQKMEAVGALAGGVAHDFNNLLTIITGNLALARMQLGPSLPAARGLADAEKAADRAAELVRQLLGFSRKSYTRPRAISLNACFGDTLDLLQRTIDPRIAIEVRQDPQLWLVEADPGQMHQIVMNLGVNARDAMPEGGRLRLETANRVLDERYCRTHPEARPGEFVALTVADTGAGMDEATRARIFDPFFTTKPVGKGTGLGLAMVYGIVKQHEGWITVDTAPGQGTSVTVFLPRSRAAQPEAAPAGAGDPARGSETILLVDDEEMILKLARTVLESSGHRVLEARDGAEALEVFTRHRNVVDLVLLDMVMPRKSGRDTLEELHRLAPELPVVLASGYTLAGAEELEALGARAYLQKPYQPADLVRTVRGVLDATPRTGDAAMFGRQEPA